jgi:hypothetical protein
MMKRMMLVAAIPALLSAGFAAAETAIYREGELYLPQGIVIRETGDEYFRHIRLQAQADGSMKLHAAEKRNLAVVEELELGVFYTNPVTVELRVTGYRHVPCVGLEPVAIHRKDHTFHVLIAETPLDPLALCAQVTAPFEQLVELDVTGVEPGEYLVLVNGMDIDFTLEDVNQEPEPGI